MHEVAICEKVKKEAEQHGKVKKINVEVGELAEIRSHDLKHHLEDMTGWEVESSEAESYVQCECGFHGRPKILEQGHDFCLFECPNCGSAPNVKEGQDINIVSVEVE